MIINPYAIFSGPPPPTDPYWANVVLLLNMEGVDGSTTFIDAKGHTMTASGDAQIDTSLGFNAALFDGAGDRIVSASSADFGFGTGDLTAEFWVRQPTGQQSGDRVLNVGAAAGTLSVGLQNGKLFAGARNVSYGPIAAVAISPDTMTHVAACKHSGTMYVYHAGVSQASASDSFDYGSASDIAIGSTSGGASTLNGWIRVLRITKGIARYPSGTTFTPPSAPFPTS